MQYQIHDPLDSDVECIDLFHLLELPHLTLPMETVSAALVAVLAQGHHGVLPMLLDVVSVAWARRIADTAGQLLNESDVGSFLGGERVVHESNLSKPRLLAFCERQTLIRSWAAIIIQRASSRLRTAS